MRPKSFYSHPRWVFDVKAVRELLQELELREPVIRSVCDAAQQVAQSAELASFFQFCQSWREDKTHDDSYSPQWNALAVISVFPQVIAKQQEMGIPWDITRATLADFQRDARGEYLHSDSWTFCRLRWMRNHATNRLFELGRLQYVVGTFAYPFRIYRDAINAEIVALALPELPCDESGWIVKENAAFITDLREEKDGIYGHIASPEDGSISSSPQRIPRNSPILLDSNSTVLQIHIPSGEKLTRDKCVKSLQMAIPFFEKYFSGTHIDALCTATWLLDRELEKVLLPTSNIVEFGALFRPLARQYNNNDTQLLERVFGVSDWKDCAADNSLRRAVLEHHRKGGSFHNTAGFILRDNVDAL